MTFNVGDRVKQRYIFDNCKHNNMPATVLEIRPYNYYPNGDYSVVETKYQSLIRYDNGDESWVDLDVEGCGILSPFERCDNL